MQKNIFISFYFIALFVATLFPCLDFYFISPFVATLLPCLCFYFMSPLFKPVDLILMKAKVQKITFVPLFSKCFQKQTTTNNDRKDDTPLFRKSPI
jgi:hypothetical protein